MKNKYKIEVFVVNRRGYQFIKYYLTKKKKKLLRLGYYFKNEGKIFVKINLYYLYFVLNNIKYNIDLDFDFDFKTNYI